MARFVGMSKIFGVYGYAFLRIRKLRVKRLPGYPLLLLLLYFTHLLYLFTNDCNDLNAYLFLDCVGALSLFIKIFLFSILRLLKISSKTE